MYVCIYLSSSPENNAQPQPRFEPQTFSLPRQCSARAMFCHENYRVALYPPTLPDSGTPLATASFRLFKISRVRHPRPYQHPRQQMPTQESKVNYFAPEKLPAVAVLEKMYNLTGIRTLYQQRLTMGGGGSNN